MTYLVQTSEVASLTIRVSTHVVYVVEIATLDRNESGEARLYSVQQDERVAILMRIGG